MKERVITDVKIRQIWLANFPTYRTDPAALETCQTVCDLIVQRARASALWKSVDNEVIYLCHDIGIPGSEFEAIRRSSD